MFVDREDLRTVYKWFTHPNGSYQSQISPNGLQTVEAIRTALSTHSLEQARRISRELFFKPGENQLEVGEILVWAALYAIHLGEPEHILFAKEQTQNAVSKFSDDNPHYLAIALWFLGFIYWQLLSSEHEAVFHWHSCLRVLNHLSYAHASLNPGWYQEIRFQVVEALFQTRMLRRYFSLKDVKYYQIEQRKRPPLSPAVPAGKPKSPRKPGSIRSLPVYQYIPAGGWGVVDPDEVGQAEIDHFIIDGTPYQAIDLIGRGQITIREREPYAIVRIKGTSMNKLDILNDDYVLIHRQDDAEHKDIVLAERKDIDSEATLKRLFRQGNTIELHPESNVLQHPILNVEKRDKLRILGIAIAVLKPVEPDTPNPPIDAQTFFE